MVEEKEKIWNKKELIYLISSSIISIILTNLGSVIWSENKIISVTAILMGFILIFFTYYLFQIRTNEDKIKELERWKEEKEEIIKTLKDIVILKKVSKIK